MAIALGTGTAQTTNVTAAQTLLMPVVASHRYMIDDSGNAVRANVVGALDQPNTIKYGVSRIADVFRGASVEAADGQRKDGNSILVQVNEVWKVADAADSTVVPYYLPASAHMVLKIPVDANITSAVVAAFILRLMGAPFVAAGDSLATAIDPLLHGVTHL